ECLAAVPADQRVRFRTHVVARGQTLATIARRYGARTKDIAEANGISVKKRVAIGTELIIPIDPKVKTASVRPAAAREEAAAAAEPSKSGPARVTYRIKPGDTLAAIASQYGTTVRDIQSWSRLRGTRIAAGEKLTIYTPRKF